MGGSGSGSWGNYRRRVQVEQCLALDLTDLRELGILASPTAVAGRLAWNDIPNAARPRSVHDRRNNRSRWSETSVHDQRNAQTRARAPRQLTRVAHPYSQKAPATAPSRRSRAPCGGGEWSSLRSRRRCRSSTVADADPNSPRERSEPLRHRSQDTSPGLSALMALTAHPAQTGGAGRDPSPKPRSMG